MKCLHGNDIEIPAQKGKYKWYWVNGYSDIVNTTIFQIWFSLSGHELIQYQPQDEQDSLFDLLGLQDSTNPVDPDALASYSANLDTPLLHIQGDDEDPLVGATSKATTSTEEVD